MTREFLDDNGALRVWFRDEIRNALLSAYATSKATTGLDRSPEAAAFRRGFTSALIAIGLNFGISPLAFIDDEQTLNQDIATQGIPVVEDKAS